MTAHSDPTTPNLREWGGALIWGGLLLLFAVMFTSLLVRDIKHAWAEAPTLSPASLAELELSEHVDRLVDVRGFELICEHAAFDGEQLLAPAIGPAGELMFVTFEHSSDCREASAAFRGKARAMSATQRSALELDDPEFDATAIAIVKPHAVEYWMFLGLLLCAGGGVLGIRTAASTRRQLIADLNPAAWTPAPTEDDKRGAKDPYRPGLAGRLITEDIGLSNAFAARLRRTRSLQAGFGVVLLGAALVAGVVGSQTISERERIWAEGVLAPDATGSGETTRSLLIVVRTKLDVTFVDTAGRVHREEASAVSLIVGVDDSVAPVVRYLPDEPERFAVSWIHEQRWGSWALLVLGSLGLLAAGIGLTVSARRDRRPEQAAAVFDDPREALLELLSVERQVVNGNETGARSYHFCVRDSELSYTHFVGPKQQPPLFLDEAQSVGIALYHPRDAAYLLVLSEDLGELQRPSFSPAQLRGRYQGIGAEV